MPLRRADEEAWFSRMLVGLPFPVVKRQEGPEVPGPLCLAYASCGDASAHTRDSLALPMRLSALLVLSLLCL